jgi:hypothetical protein
VPPADSQNAGPRVERGNASARAPVVIGHSFGGLIVQKVANAGAASAAIDNAPIMAEGFGDLHGSAVRHRRRPFVGRRNDHQAAPPTMITTATKNGHTGIPWR